MQLTFDNGKLNIQETTIEELQAFLSMVNKTANDSIITQTPSMNISADTEDFENTEDINDIQKANKEENKPKEKNESISDKVTKTYTTEFKDKVIKEYLSGKTYTELCGKYGIPRGTLATWIARKKENDKHFFEGRRKSVIKFPTPEISIKERKNKLYTLSEEETEFKKHCLTIVSYISNATNTTNNQVLNDVYNKMTNEYGIVFQELLHVIREEIHVEGWVSTLDTICMSSKEHVKKLFLDILLSKAASLPLFVEKYKDCPEAIAEIAKITGDKLNNFPMTYKAVYDYMTKLFKIDWDYYTKKYHKNSTAKVKYGILIKKFPNLQKYFVTSINLYTYMLLEKAS